MLPYTRLRMIYEHDDYRCDDNDLVPPWGLFPLADFAFWSTAPVSPFQNIIIVLMKGKGGIKNISKDVLDGNLLSFFGPTHPPGKDRRRRPRSLPNHR